MDVYKIPIEYAFIVFPFIAFILTIPFLIHQYRKFGSIPILKSVCFYSMILYVLCAYFLVILPLPPIEKVASMNGPNSQLVPFQFIKDIIATTSFGISSFSDVLNIFKNSTVYTVLFNIILTLPFGVYLRYLLKKKWYHSLIYTFLLSLFFELTQLSGLYGIYPRPYRLFDVDDLFINSLGGLIGYMITPLITFFIPTIDELDEKSYKRGSRVTLLRRVVSLTIDILFILALSVFARILLYGTNLEEYFLLIVLTLYYIVIPPFNMGKTFGKKVLKTKIASFDAEAKWYQILIRNSLLVYIVIYPYAWISILEKATDLSVVSRLWSVIIICQVANILYYIYTLIAKRPHTFLYEKITNTINISTIEVKISEVKLQKKKTKKKKIIENNENIEEDNCKNK